MALPGRAPNPDRSQVRHRNPVADWTDVPDVPFEGHLLPQRFVHRGGAEVKADWPQVTTRWWGVVRRMPHCKLWSASDWEFAFGTAEVHARFSEGTGSGTELRQREAKMGVQVEDRRKLRIRYVKPSTASEVEAKTGKDPRAGGNVTKVDFGMYGDPS
jgi:hypothetical protein